MHDPNFIAASSPRMGNQKHGQTPSNMECAMIAKLVLQTLLYIAGMGALLFIAAGTLHWPAAWVFLGTIAVLGLGSGVWLAKTDPALLAERMRPMMQDEQPAADKKFMLVFGAAALAWFIVIGLDARFQASNVPAALQALGLVLLVASTAYIMWVMRENSFAAPVVKVQTERGHHVVDTRPLRPGAASDVLGHGVVLFRRAAAAGIVVGRRAGAAVRGFVRNPCRHRGARAARRPAGLCGVHGTGALSISAGNLVAMHEVNCLEI
jgi:protein-S-isoprenylcysteine O-methyltransferase Ste14